MDRSVQEGWAQDSADLQRAYDRPSRWRGADGPGGPSGGSVVDGGPLPADHAAEERLTRLAHAIEHEIIPRLMLAHRAAEACPVVPALVGEKIGQRDVEDFAKLVLVPDEDLPLACVEALRARGISVESIYLDLLAPTARYLGYLWTEDLCDFTEVTVGLGRLQQVLRELSPSFERSGDLPENGLRALLLPSPGEQHTFGLVMVGEFFRRGGWLVSGGPWETALDAPAMVTADWYDLVGFSLGAEVHLEALRDCIAVVRRNSRNRQVAIMVGGPIFIEHPEYVEQVGADALGTDGRQAPALAARMIVERRAAPS